MGQVKHRIADQHHQFFVLAPKLAAQRLLTDLFDHAFAHPLPELFLRGPKFLVVLADHQRRALASFSFLFVRYRHLSVTSLLDTLRRSPESRAAVGHEFTPYPEGKPLARGSVNFQNPRANISPAP